MASQNSVGGDRLIKEYTVYYTYWLTVWILKRDDFYGFSNNVPSMTV